MVTTRKRTKNKFGVYNYPNRDWIDVPEGTNYSQLQEALSRGIIIHHTGKHFMVANSEKEWKDYMDNRNETLKQDRINQQRIFAEAFEQDRLRRMEYQAQTPEFQRYHLSEARWMFKEHAEREKELKKEQKKIDAALKSEQKKRDDALKSEQKKRTDALKLEEKNRDRAARAYDRNEKRWIKNFLKD